MLVLAGLALTVSLSSFLVSREVLNFLTKKISQSKSRRFLFKQAEEGVYLSNYYWRIFKLLTPVFFILATSLLISLIYGLLVGCVFWLASWYWGKRKVAKRVELCQRQLPLMLKYLTGGLAAGYSLFQALKYTAKSLPSPTKDELNTVVERISLGVTVEEAFAEMSQKIPLKDLKLILVTILVQKKTGGNLVKILKQTQELLEERQSLKNELFTQTAQVRFSSAVVGVLPLAVLLFITLTDPSYMQPLWQTQQGQFLLFIAFVLEVAGYLVIKKLMAVSV